MKRIALALCATFMSMSASADFMFRASAGMTLPEAQTQQDGATESQPELGPNNHELVFHLDYTLYNNDDQMTNLASGDSFTIPTGTVSADGEGKFALNGNHRNYITNTPTQSLNLADWTVEVELAPPYITPNASTAGFHPFIMRSGNYRYIGLYRSGGNGSGDDGFVYNTVGSPDSSTITTPDTALLDKGTVRRLQREVTFPVEKLRWEKVDGRINTYVNGNHWASIEATASDELTGSWDIFKGSIYVHPDLLVRSFKLWGTATP
ncbi:hypothetical protein [Neptuniibacter sp. QD37_11]|uniref:hypothetical protein n=1 Tax=Neptuniibacter sp. QD37_11 TaxID=3398209 RepID=UPI0039F530E9